jgi:serine/threonine protein phosphatase PrpC
LDVERESLTDCDVLVMATDGLWDVVANEAVAEVVEQGLKIYEDADEARKKYRYGVCVCERIFSGIDGTVTD